MTLYYYEEMTMHEIGLALGVVESRVSQVHSSAVVHLRVALIDFATRGAFGRTPLRKLPAQVRSLRSMKKVRV
jgi:RNA polymerase sigma factor for flagellar operon FliA